jgi:hypothetical protein
MRKIVIDAGKSRTGILPEPYLFEEKSSQQVLGRIEQCLKGMESYWDGA